MRTNLTQCRLDYSNPTADDIAKYGWSGPITYIPRNATTQISFKGCEALCGSSSQMYPWGQVSSTITTWVLPVVGILVQAPFNSNAFWETIFSLARWIGSPMASFSYILWNIKVSGKCALLVDLAVEYGDDSNNEDFLSIRDSFYLLMTMNQYTMKEDVLQKKEAEGLLRVALFSKDLRLLKPEVDPDSAIYRAYLDPDSQVYWGEPGQAPIGPLRSEDALESEDKLNELRQSLASDLRSARRRGVVPVFISTLWFVFSLGLSIQAAFGFLGENAQAHDLALGLLLAWLPVLILSSIVDRNPVASNKIRFELNALIDRVRLSLMDDTVKQNYLRTITDVGHQTRMVEEVEKRSRACPDLENFFVKFAGQGRKRFHYGVAHPILTDIEQAYIAEKGRNWLANEKEARTILVLGDARGGLDWLDPRELWQVLSAVVIVGGTILGAFCLSYFTPTVGVGCRSGGYMVFGSVSFGLLLVEMVLWWAFDSSKQEIREYTRRLTENHPRRQDWLTWYERQHLAFTRTRAAVFRACSSFVWTQLRNRTPQKFALRVEEKCEKYQSAPVVVDHFFFKFVECFNTVWLTYITMSQTTGHYNNCRCKSSLWFGGGGYIDWNNYNTATSKFVRYNWIIATVFSTTIMAVAMLYIVTEWCLQSHLSTANLENATNGLWFTRRFRWLTSPFRDTIHYLIEYSYAVRKAISSLIRGFCCCYRRGEQTETTTPAGQASGQNRRSVRWTSKSDTRPAPPQSQPQPRTPSPAPSGPNQGIELHPYPLNRPRASSNAPSDAPSDAPLIRSSDEGRRDSSISPSRSSGGRTSSGGEASSSRLPRASGESSAGPGRGSGGSNSLQVPFNPAHYGSETV
jgi:hypothetical protein